MIPPQRSVAALSPGWSTQVATLPAHRFSSPRPQASQAKQAPRCQPTPTRCPRSRVRTSVPSAATVPTISWPGIMG